MERAEQAVWRKHRVTGTDIRTIMRGGPAAWNTLARQLREGKPFYGAATSPGMPAQLRWGQEKEEITCEQFWLRHPEYTMTDIGFIQYSAQDPVRHQHCGVSPDRILLREGYDPENGPHPMAPLEAKTPHDPNVHQKYCLGGTVPDEHICQLRWAMHLLDSDEGWFVSHDPRDPNRETNYCEYRVTHDQAFEDIMLEKLDLFIEGFLAGTEFTTQYLKPINSDKLRDMF